MRDKVTISIDAKLKRIYEDMFGKEWSDLLDEAVREKLLKSGKIEGIKAVIRIVEEEQEERRQMLLRAEQQTESLLTKVQETFDIDLENRRERWYLFHEKELKKLYERHKLQPNWLSIKLEFEKPSEAMSWVLKRFKKNDVHDKI